MLSTQTRTVVFLAAGLRMVLDGLPVEIIRNNLIKEIRFARDRLIDVGYVCPMMFIVVNLHCLPINVGFERIFWIR